MAFRFEFKVKVEECDANLKTYQTWKKGKTEKNQTWGKILKVLVGGTRWKNIH